MDSQSVLHAGIDDDRPSLFGTITNNHSPVQQANVVDAIHPSLSSDLISEQQLHNLLPPSLRYILAVAAHRHPRLLLRALNSFDELYAAVSLVVEWYYLRTFGGSFTENVYGLKRERVPCVQDGEIPRAQFAAPELVRETLKLHGRDVWKNLAVMVAIPYVRHKLDEDYDIHIAPQASLVGGGNAARHRLGDTFPRNPTIKQRLMYYYKWFLRKIYPSVNAAYYFSLLAFSLGYLFNNTKYSSPFLWLLGTRIRRLGFADYDAIDEALRPTPSRTPSGMNSSFLGSKILGFLCNAPRKIYPLILRSLKLLLPVSIFALKFLEWWHASDFSRLLFHKTSDALDLPPPVVSGMDLPAAATAASKQPSLSPKTEKSLADETIPRPTPPISSITSLPIFTVPYPATAGTALSESEPTGLGHLCPICLSAINNPTACQTGYIFCYTCIFRWVNGEHPRQERFVERRGGVGEAQTGTPGVVMVWDRVDGVLGEVYETGQEEPQDAAKRSVKDRMDSREVAWESGKDRCPVTGRRLLGGTDGLRRLLV